MKTFISIVLCLFLFWLVIFQLDPMIINWIMSKIPTSVGEWKGLIEVAAWIVLLIFTLSPTIWISVGIAGFVRAMLSAKDINKLL